MKPLLNNKYLKFCAENCSETLDTKGGTNFLCLGWAAQIFPKIPRGTNALHTALKLPQGIRHLLYLIMF